MPSLQTQTAIDTLSELYGEPSWITDPKPGQNVDKVFDEWDKALKKYSDTQVANACRSIYKYKKSATFPRLGHLLAELVDIVPDAEPEDDEPKTGYWQERLQRAFLLFVRHRQGHLPRLRRYRRRISAGKALGKANGFRTGQPCDH